MKFPDNLELRRGIDMREPLVPERLGGEPPKVTGGPIVKKDSVSRKTRQPSAGIPALPRVYGGANQWIHGANLRQPVNKPSVRHDQYAL